LRISSLQYDPAVRGSFSSAGFILEGIEQERLLGLLLDDWRPAPIVTPWNNASGFYQSSKGRLAAAAMDAVVTSEAPRFGSLIRVIRKVRELVADAGYQDAPEKEEKAKLLSRLRGVLPDDAVAWIDAVAVVDEGDVRMMPVLGSGGNEGVLDYSGLFLRSLVDVALGDRERSARLLRSALFGDSVSELPERPAGQFDPGTAGGFNTGPGFEFKDLPNNPWTFVLLVEGALVWASGIASRQQGAASGYRFAVSPFTVRHRAAGYGSAGYDDDDPQRVRAEVWMPVWRRPTGLAEITRFIAEGRVEVRERNREPKRAVDSLDFAEAVTSLGVDRGVDHFVRYAFVKRRGESYIALPAGVLDVRYRRDVDLLPRLDAEMAIIDRFLARFPGEQGPPAHLLSLRRAIDDARFEVAERGGFDPMTRVIRAIGALEMNIARRDPSKDPRLPRPLGGLGSEWVEACGHEVEVRLAAALASIEPTGGAGPFRSYVAPLSPHEPNRYAPSTRTLVWSGIDVADRIANVLHRRLLDVRSRSSDEAARGRNPTWGARRVSLDDVAMFLAPGLVDDRALEELMFGFTWVKHSRSVARQNASVSSPPLPRSYALLKLLFLPHAIARGREPIRLVPDPAIVPLLRGGSITEAVEIARRQLAAKGLRPRRVVENGPSDSSFGRRLAAALLFPVSQITALEDRALLPRRDE
jgi:CRISPR-associated protein Csx17